MAIRFQCPSCSQPIEVDDEWASKIVACPFCRNTTQAPALSTLPDLADVPVASPASGRGYTRFEAVAGSDSALALSPGNRTAVAAAVLTGLQLLLLVMIQWVLLSHRLEVEEFQKTFTGQTFYELLENQRRFFEARGGIPQWLVAVVFMQLVMGLAWVAAVVCGIIGMRRAERRGLAITALLVSGTLAAFLCAGMFLGAAPVR